MKNLIVMFTLSASTLGHAVETPVTPERTNQQNNPYLTPEVTRRSHTTPPTTPGKGGQRQVNNLMQTLRNQTADQSPVRRRRLFESDRSSEVDLEVNSQETDHFGSFLHSLDNL